MPLTIAGRHRRRVRFPATNLPPALISPSGVARQQQQQQQEQGPLGQEDLFPFQSVTKSSKSAKFGKSQKSTTSPGMATQPEPRPGIPSLFTQPPPIRDPLVTETTRLQEATVEKCLTFLKGLHPSQTGPFNDTGVPALHREDHVTYLYESLEDYPAGFVAMDASRPWMVYWALAGLALLGEDPTHLRERVLGTLRPMQNATGGFGGGHGQTSHLASSYAAVLALAMVGGAEAFALVDRDAMWRWLGRLKQADGGFSVTEGGEEDVRGAYCASTIIALLDIPLVLPPDATKAREAGFETLTDGLAEYLSRCQSFEGGISGSPGVEAHGAYAFCALACLSILGAPEEIIPKHMNLPLLLSWLSARQYAPEGGFSGRTNKLVDGCYSHWVGGCWPLLQSALDGKPQPSGAPPETVGSLFSRDGLDRYILGCCQTPMGGLRDKPGKSADSYHTCYVLTGLSATQHHHYRTNASISPDSPFASAFSWQASPVAVEESVYESADRLVAFHPLFVIPHQAAANMRIWCESNPIHV